MSNLQEIFTKEKLSKDDLIYLINILSDVEGVLEIRFNSLINSLKFKKDIKYSLDEPIGFMHFKNIFFYSIRDVLSDVREGVLGGRVNIQDIKLLYETFESYFETIESYKTHKDINRIEDIRNRLISILNNKKRE